jgi:hypothetical protein
VGRGRKRRTVVVEPRGKAPDGLPGSSSETAGRLVAAPAVDVPLWEVPSRSVDSLADEVGYSEGAAAYDQALLQLDELRPLEALRRVGRVRLALELLEARAVTVAREQGSSWSAIGQALGNSRQAVHERFADRVSTLSGEDGDSLGADAASSASPSEAVGPAGPWEPPEPS